MQIKECVQRNIIIIYYRNRIYYMGLYPICISMAVCVFVHICSFKSVWKQSPASHLWARWQAHTKTKGVSQTLVLYLSFGPEVLDGFWYISLYLVHARTFSTHSNNYCLPEKINKWRVSTISLKGIWRSGVVWTTIHWILLLMVFCGFLSAVP